MVGHFFYLIFILFLCVFEIGCGVRGAPVPPNYTTTLGRGRPNYQKLENKITPAVLPTEKEVEEEIKNKKKKQN